MKKLNFILFLLCFSLETIAQTTATPDPKLLGSIEEKSLRQPPYDAWFSKNYADYKPNETTIAALKKVNIRNWSVTIFLGTWCGDTKRELPRLVKTLDEMGFPKEKITLIAVDNDEKTYKQSPTHEERGLSIFRVPTFIFYEKNVEKARIIETPAESHERDLLTIFEKKPYKPNYNAYATVEKWIKSGILADENVNPAGLARQIEPLVMTESELNAVGYTLMGSERLKEAIMVFRVNVYLYPKSANPYDSLAEAYLKSGDKQRALKLYETALQLDPNNKNIAKSIEKLKKEF